MEIINCKKIRVNPSKEKANRRTEKTKIRGDEIEHEETRVIKKIIKEKVNP